MFIGVGEQLQAKRSRGGLSFFHVKAVSFDAGEDFSACVCVSVTSLRGCTVYSHVSVCVCLLMTL